MEACCLLSLLLFVALLGHVTAEVKCSECINLTVMMRVLFDALRHMPHPVG